jgi:hypothetical protein
MKGHDRTRTRPVRSAGRACAYAILVIAILAAWSATFTTRALGGQQVFACNPVEVYTATKNIGATKIHVKCSPGDFNDNIQYFVLGTDDTAEVSRVLSIMLTALAARRNLTTVYEFIPSADPNVQNLCPPANCRMLQGVAVW